MAITKINAPGSTPSVFWPETISQLSALVMDKEQHARNNDTHILKGSLFNIGGSLFVADSDTLISGTKTDYIKLTVSANIAQPSYVSSFSGVTWNSDYKGFYDSSGNLYLNVPQSIYQFRTGKKEILTGSGNYTVPLGVYTLKIYLVGPGDNGEETDNYSSGRGGNSGEEIIDILSVIPGQVISYSVTTTNTTFGSIVARKGYGYTGGGGGAGGCNGGQGAGIMGGTGGTYSSNGGNAIAGYGGGGGGSYGYGGTGGSAGTGATGRIEIT